MEHAKNMHFIAAFTQEVIHHLLWRSVIEIQEIRIDVKGGHTCDCADVLTRRSAPNRRTPQLPKQLRGSPY